MPDLALSDRQRFDWLRLIRTESVGPRTFCTLVNRFGSAGAALAALPDLARAAGRPVNIPSVAAIEREMEQARRLGVRFVALGEGAYPRALAACRDTPPLLAVRGQLAVLSKPMVALVGSRNASGLGLKFTEKLARELGEAGFVVVSGLARGIDTAAHRASLATGTVAALAGGHGQIYPPQNEPLVEDLIATGAAVSELPFTMEPRARDFPRRNRIVAGLSLGVVVVEAAARSGSLITARLANEEGRTVFAVPGSPLDPRAEGTNQLIHAGARLCRSAEDVISELAAQVEPGPPAGGLFEAPGPDRRPAEDAPDELDWLLAGQPAGTPSRDGVKDHDRDSSAVAHAPTPEAPEGTLRPVREVLLDLLGAAALGIDDLARHSALGVRVVQGELVELEMDGLVRREASGGYVRV